jgi:hypothetical protein
MSTQGQPTEEQLRAAYEAEMKRIRVDDLLLETVVNMVNLGMRRTGLVPGTEDERDARQVHVAVESIRALLPLLEQSAPQQIGPIRQALSQLQLAYDQLAGGGADAGTAAAEPPAEARAEPPSEARAEPGAEPPAEPGAEPPVVPRAESSAAPAEAEIKPGEPGPAQRSGRLWVPGSR